MRAFCIVLTCLLAACGTAPQVVSRTGAESAALGIERPEVELIDLYGNRVRPLESGGRPVVFLFVSTDCPISNRYAPEMGRLVDDYGDEADFWVVYSNPGESVSAIREHAKDRGNRARVARDTAHRLVQLAEARVTPEATVFSAVGELIYTGRIDDRWVDFGRSRQEPTVRDLERVLLAVLAGTELDPIRTAAVGCPITDLP